MAIGISLHIGVNQAEPAFNVTKLKGCVNDADIMSRIAVSRGFWAKRLVDEEATFDRVKEAILWAASILTAGDIFFFTFAGHGSFMSPDVVLDEDDFKDETILLHDCLLIDNYLRRILWTQFAEGVRILGIADSCHSGSVLLALAPATIPGIPVVTGLAGDLSVGGVALDGVNVLSPVVGAPVRGLTRDDRERIVGLRTEIHEKLRNEVLATVDNTIKAQILSLSACEDNQEAVDGDPHGAFTNALLQVWDDANFSGTYTDFIQKIQAKFPPGNAQHPTLRPANVNQEFLNQRPFTI